MTFLINGRSPRFRMAAGGGTPGGGEGMILSICGGINFGDVTSEDRFMVWTSDGEEPELTGDATASVYEFNAWAGMYWIDVASDGFLGAGTIGGSGPMAAMRITDYQNNCA